MSMREPTVMKKNKEMDQIRNELVICELLCTLLLTRFQKGLLCTACMIKLM